MKKISNPSDIEEYYKALPDLVPQVVNLNGSTQETLLEDYKEVLRLLRELDRTMGKATPHGRDYQTHSNPEATLNARRAWDCRRMLIYNILEDVQYSAEMVANQPSSWKNIR